MDMEDEKSKFVLEVNIVQIMLGIELWNRKVGKSGKV